MNVQHTIIKSITEQLYVHNYLVIPNFGGFVLKTQSAQLNFNGAVTTPPSKTISFNAQLKQNDGVLVICLQSKLNCTANEALNYLNDFATYCTSILNTSKRITFENIGFFYIDFENNICFEPQTNTNFLTSSFGLTPLTLKKIEVETIKKQALFVDKTHQKAIQQPIIATKNYKKVIMPSLIVMAVVSLLALFISNNKITGSLKATILGTSTKINYKPLTYLELKLQTNNNSNTTYVVDANGIATINLEETKTIFVNTVASLSTTNLAVTTKKTTAKHSPNFETVTTNSYKIVLGCFGIVENAERMINTLKNSNINANLSGKNNKGLFVVSNGSFATKQAALEQLAQIKGTCPNAWIKNPE